MLLINVFFGWNIFLPPKSYLTGSEKTLRRLPYVPFVSLWSPPGFSAKKTRFLRFFIKKFPSDLTILEGFFRKMADFFLRKVISNDIFFIKSQKPSPTSYFYRNP